MEVLVESFVGRLLLVVVFVYALVCLVAYWWQERLLFHPTPLDKDFAFPFDTDFEELYLDVAPGVQLHALHFRAAESKGLVFYVHGNAGSLHDWGSLAGFYLQHDHDLLMFDYRGFGKSPGKIYSQQQFFDDVQAVYDWAKTQYPEARIVVEGFSIGTATATKIAAENNPRQLVLKAPYYSLQSLVKSKAAFLPTRILKYRFATVDYLKQVRCPATIFHGTADELIPYQNAERLKAAVPNVDLWLVEDCLHNDLPFTEIYKREMGKVLVLTSLDKHGLV
jgi:pimeloyl-ACP methyl ester carboxylesterase